MINLFENETETSSKQKISKPLNNFNVQANEPVVNQFNLILIEKYLLRCISLT